MYETALHLHVSAVVISLALFSFRFALTLKGSDVLQRKWLKITPHVVDTVLLATAIWLLTISSMVNLVSVFRRFCCSCLASICCKLER
ncbi:SirB2 family protein [Brumicola pallidula]|jgi:uncharacterized membrane protein SirB2|uniref:SirB2 family protein n=1 Tax=Brumicola pallidula TaxID=56807 RepID=UPI0009DB3CCE|nr:SirB2 family protein [Glaciecola pallidula]